MPSIVSYPDNAQVSTYELESSYHATLASQTELSHSNKQIRRSTNHLAKVGHCGVKVSSQAEKFLFNSTSGKVRDRCTVVVPWTYAPED